MNELEKAHNDYEERKERLIDNLTTMAANFRGDEYIPQHYVEWLEYAIEFIKEKEI